jgi:hypothetical protein
MQFRKVLVLTLTALLLMGATALAQQPAEQPKPAKTPDEKQPETDKTSTPAASGEAPEPTPAKTAGDEEAGDEEGTDEKGTDEKGTQTTKGDAPMDGATYAVRLRDLQQRIDQLKEQIRRSHTRLSLLSDTILSGGASGSRTSIQFENKLSNQFRVTRALVVLDGAVQYNKTDRSGALAEQKRIPIFSGSIPPGDHTVQVLINLRGHGYGVFSYLRGYRFEVRSSHSFTAVEGKTTKLRILAYEKGGVTTPLEERPAIRYLEKVISGLAPTSKPASK